MITLAQVIAVTGPIGNDEPVIVDLISRATAELGRELGRYLGPPLERTEIRHGGCACGPRVPFVVLHDDPTPETDVGVRMRQGVFRPWEEQTVDGQGNPVVAVDGRRVYHSSGWPPGNSTVEVTYTAGYDAGKGPEELQSLVLQRVAEQYASIGAAAMGDYKSRTLGDHSWTKWTPDEMKAAAGTLGIDWESFVARWRRRLA